MDQSVIKRGVDQNNCATCARSPPLLATYKNIMSCRAFFNNEIEDGASYKDFYVRNVG